MPKSPFRFSMPLIASSVFLYLLFTLMVPGYADELDPASEPKVVRAYFSDPALVAEVASWREPWEVNYDAGFIVLHVTSREEAALRALGFSIMELPELTEFVRRLPLDQPSSETGIPSFPCYRTVEETFATLADLAATQQDLVELVDIGDSWEKQAGLGGYDIYLVRISNQAINGPKPKLFLMASMHARELATAELVTRFAEHLVAGYGFDADITWILDHHEIHLVPHVNPDGRKFAENLSFWRKNTNQDYCGPHSESRGADLNRNFEFEWGNWSGSSSDECSELYRGPLPASEPETQAIQDYLRANYPDNRAAVISATAPLTTTGIFLDIHSYGELILWPWGFSSSPAPNGEALQTLGRKLAFFNGYRPEQAIELYPTDGTSPDFAYGDLGLAAYTYELGTGFFQDCRSFESQILPENLSSLMYAARVVQGPYTLPSGPEVTAITLTQSMVQKGMPLTLTVRLDDSRFNGQNGQEAVQEILAAGLSVDQFPATIAQLSHSLNPLDGQFDQPQEVATLVLDTGNLAPGRHRLYFRAQDGSGAWGPVYSRFLTVVEGQISNTFLPSNPSQGD